MTARLYKKIINESYIQCLNLLAERGPGGCSEDFYCYVSVDTEGNRRKIAGMLSGPLN